MIYLFDDHLVANLASRLGKALVEIILLCAAFSIYSVVGAKEPNPFVIKFATVAPEGSTWMKQMWSIALDLRKKSKGRLLFKIYAGGIAGGELEILKKIRLGQLQSAAFTGVGFGQILPEVRVLDLPFLFRSYAEVDCVLSQLKPYFRKRFESKGFILLNWAEVGNVYVFSKKPIAKTADFAQCRPWSWAGDPIAKETFSALGVTPIVLPITDVTTALATGMVDTVYAPPLGLLALQWHPYVRYMNPLPFAHSTGALLLSHRAWNKLPPDLKSLLLKVFEQGIQPLTAKLREQNRKAIDVLTRQGLKVLSPPKGSDLAGFDSIHRRVAAALSGKIYPATLLKEVYKILGRN